MAQLGARLDGIEEVVGSNPIGSTKEFLRFNSNQKRRFNENGLDLADMRRSGAAPVHDCVVGYIEAVAAAGRSKPRPNNGGAIGLGGGGDGFGSAGGLPQSDVGG